MSFASVDAAVTRRVLAERPALMGVEFAFGPGARGLPPSHPQSYVASGRFAFTVAGKAREIGPGDGLGIAGGAAPSCDVIEPGAPLDAIPRRRDDFL